MESYGLTAISSNRKVGPIPVSTSSKETCPDDCPLKDGPCYGEGGPVAIHWKAITKGERGDDFDTFTIKVKAMPLQLLAEITEDGDNLSVGQRQLVCLAESFKA